MTAALAGWAGLLVLTLAALCALLADVWRQSAASPSGRGVGSTGVRVVTALAVALTLVGVVATLLRLTGAAG